MLTTQIRRRTTIVIQAALDAGVGGRIARRFSHRGGTVFVNQTLDASTRAHAASRSGSGTVGIGETLNAFQLAYVASRSRLRTISVGRASDARPSCDVASGRRGGTVSGRKTSDALVRRGIASGECGIDAVRIAQTGHASETAQDVAGQQRRNGTLSVGGASNASLGLSHADQGRWAIRRLRALNARVRR